MKIFIIESSYKLKSDYKHGTIKTKTCGSNYKHGQWAGKLIKDDKGLKLEVIADDAVVDVGDEVEFYQPPRLLGKLKIKKKA